MELTISVLAEPIAQPPPLQHASLEHEPFVSPLAHEPPAQRCLFACLALLVLAGYAWMVGSYWTGAHPGVDQNGYLVGGRMFAQHWSTRMDPRSVDGKYDPFGYVATMWVGADLGTDNERFYPKYPIGLPMLVAGAWRLGGLIDHWTGAQGPTWGPALTYYVGPAAVVLAVWGVFLMTRFLAGSLAGIAAMILFALSPTTLELANNPNSHASTVFCVTWGAYLLLRWWAQGGAFKAMGAGLLLGYAATIRYTEAMLGAPLLLMVLFRVVSRTRRVLRFRKREYGSMGVWVYGSGTGAHSSHPHTPTPPHPHTLSSSPAPSPTLLRPYLEGILALTWWALPVLLLIVFNLKSVGSWTGYDPTNESIGFGWKYFDENWEPMLRQVNAIGMFFVMPLAAAGLVGLLFARWQIGVLMATWILPNLAIYTFYYWAPDVALVGDLGRMTGYLRFFFTTFPAMVACAMWMIARTALLSTHPLTRAQRIATTIAAPLLLVGWTMIWDPVYRIAAASDLPMLADLASADSSTWTTRLLSAAAGATLALAAVAVSWLIDRRRTANRLAIGAALAIGLVVVVGSLENWEMVETNLDREQRRNLLLAATTRELAQRIPQGSVLFLDRTPRESPNHLQFALGDVKIYSTSMFAVQTIRGFEKTGKQEPDEPVLVDPEIRKNLWNRLKGYTQDDLLREGRRIILGAIDTGRRAFVLMPRSASPSRGGLGRRGEMAFDRFLRDPGRDGDELTLEPVCVYQNNIPSPPREASVVKGRWRGGNPRGNARDSASLAWQLMEIKRKPPPAPPTTRPATTQP